MRAFAALDVGADFGGERYLSGFVAPAGACRGCTR